MVVCVEVYKPNLYTKFIQCCWVKPVVMAHLTRLLWCRHQSTLHGGFPGSIATALSSNIQQQSALQTGRRLYCAGATGLWPCSAHYCSSCSESSRTTRTGFVLHTATSAGEITGPHTHLPSPSLPPCRVSTQGTNTWYRVYTWCLIDQFSLLVNTWHQLIMTWIYLKKQKKT